MKRYACVLYDCIAAAEELVQAAESDSQNNGSVCAPDDHDGVWVGFCLAMKMPQQSNSPLAVEPRGMKDVVG